MNNVRSLATNFGSDVKGIASNYWAEAANLDWHVEQEELQTTDGQLIEGKKALRNSRTGSILGVVSDRYQVVQPSTMLETFNSAVTDYGFNMDRLGSYGGGKVIWGRADMHREFNLNGNDPINYYMYFVTSTDGSAATHAFISTLRVACMNALNVASKASGAHLNVRHSSEYRTGDFDKRLTFLDADIECFEEKVNALSYTPIDNPESFGAAFKKVYGDRPAEVGRSRVAWFNKIEQISDLMHTSPGAELNRLGSSYWDFLNAVTYDIDHNNSTRSDENSHRHSIMRAGAKKKEQAFNDIYELAIN